jgi:hypothetical protein
MLYCKSRTGIFAVDVFLLMKGTNIEIGDVGGLDTFSVKEHGMEKVFWQI